MAISRKDLKNGESVFRVPISNSLGIESLQARAELKRWALSKPDEYTAWRNKVYVNVVKNMVQSSHDIIWELLAVGKYKDDAGAVQQLKIKNAGGADTPWSPSLPDQQIASLANGFAESMMTAFEEVMDKVLPDDYRQMAEEKQVNIGKINNVLKP